MPVKITAIAAFLVGFFGIALAHAHDRAVFGWVEMATIEPWDTKVKAKADTGALTSSMHAEDVEEFEKNDENWVRFTIEITDEANGEKVSKAFEKPVYRHLVVHGAGGQDRRPVVLMKLCIADTIYEEQFSLEDRDDMNYPVLLGRRTIQSLGFIDVTRTFTREPQCGGTSSVQRHRDKEADEDIGI